MTTVGCTCVVSLEVLLGPEAGKTTPWADLGSTHPTGVIAIGRSKKFVFGKGPQGENRAGLLLSADLDVSSRHAQVVLDYTMGVLCVLDCKSTNGTKLNDVALPPGELRPLSDGDTITAGSSLIVFRVHQQCTSCKTRNAAPLPSPLPPAASSVSPSFIMSPALDSSEAPVQQEISPALPSLGPLNETAESDFLPSPPRKVADPQHNCIVCFMSLWGLDSMARQEHVNACLDETSSKSKKSRRRIPASADKHQMELAVALSRSVVGEEIECMLTRGMMEREIADIDAAIAKLQKKRESLVRKLQKNAKEIKRFAPSSILPPEVVVQWDVQAVLADMFPPSRRLEPRSNEPNAKELSHDDGEHQRERDRPSKVCKRGAVSALWQHAAATSEDNVVVPSFARYIMSTAFPVEDVPIEVKVIFPEWKENLMFLQSSTAASLDAALACLRAEMAKLQPSQYDTDAAKYKAFSYFELRMEALLDAKSNHRLNAQTLSGGGEGPSNLPHEQQNR
ncbi:hypothetical protein H310_13307 [Aphanomyces invadans]|uniref:FHA domain-containing protein n=1 Tax=Aphanomyces invadans TaxID=157072 RepID=A0A024TEH8_9STRA|nr:hypothetical protein H310_13307 [Aphanomyces invadans]ETV92428.1 hypothetical protein H310_13307 [Aphanomyces invadans]|eukprot:XP_008878979.1 hypothetical protein H310_13307 [Aphanomyces invadans]